MTDRSVYAINSGPASAPQAGPFVATPFGKKNVITIDLGGTSFDITLTKEGIEEVATIIVVEPGWSASSTPAAPSSSGAESG